MAENEIRVWCSHKNCIYFRQHADDPAGVYCTHPEIDRHLDQRTCPLYRPRMDGNIDRVSEMLSRFYSKKA